MEYRIPEPNIKGLNRRLANLNKRAAASGASPILLKEIRVDSESTKNGAFMRYHVFELDVKCPIIPDWNLVAVIEHKKSLGNVIRALPGMSVPNRYRKSTPICEHCNMSRRRKDTYLVRFQDTSTHKQVGSNCLKEFLGSEYLSSQLISLGSLLKKTQNTLGSFSDWENPFWMINTRTYLGYVVLTIRESGWVPISKSERLGTSPTSVEAFQRMTETLPPGVSRDYPLPADFAAVDAALEWGKSQGNGVMNDYLHNLSVICHCEGLEHRDLGIAASLISAHQRTLSERVVEPKVVRGFFGVLEAREVFQLSVKGISHHDGHYGVSHLHRFEDQNGNLAIWWSSKKVLDVGKTYNLKCTVKEHTEYQGTPQTVLTRCSIV